MIISKIEKANQKCPWKVVQLVNMYLPYFSLSDEDEDGNIGMNMNVNVQHVQLGRHTTWDFEIFELKLCLDYGRKQFNLSPSANNQVTTIVPYHVLRHEFKATVQ
jgi:hypothetical protein